MKFFFLGGGGGTKYCNQRYNYSCYHLFEILILTILSPEKS